MVRHWVREWGEGRQGGLGRGFGEGMRKCFHTPWNWLVDGNILPRGVLALAGSGSTLCDHTTSTRG